MIDAWTWPAWVGVLLGSLLFVGVLVPVLVLQSRRYGGLSLPRLLGAAALAVYLVTLAAYTLLPLPSGDLDAWCAEHAVGHDLVPLHSLADIRRETAGLGTRATLTSAVTLQVVLNVVLFVPWGVLARRFLGLSLVTSVLSGFVASTLIELSQYTGLFGLIGCSYRVGDVDDVLTNTAGALLGATLAPAVLGWMPGSAELHEDRGRARPVTVWRRWSAMVVDLGTYALLGYATVVSYRLVLLATGHEIPLRNGWPEWVAAVVVPTLLVVVGPAATGSGASLGQRALWLVPDWPGRPRVADRLRRCLGTAGTLALVHAVATAPGHPGWVPGAASAATAVLLVAAVVAVPLTRDRRGLSGLVAGVPYRDARAG
ncbi:VanZ family protein [Aeromicrobium sp. IC_218]|uniref:VanZ family protein n=1 Tax=Aeromicrobium sp. IC_218 TaxID=2545468 RepID=UPI0013F46795|nr:VanZ family protein [Aeromicrobium sp. IC_218]